MISDWLFLFAIAGVAFLAGSIASVSGFGIGSLLTPLLAIQVGTKLAVAVVSIPHLFATTLRLWIMRKQVDQRLLWSFGLMSAAGGLVGALFNAYANSPPLTILFGILLILAGILGLTGLSQRLRFRGWVGWVAGAVSGMLGGLVGNQGGIRSAAMLGFDVSRNAFVATATAVGVIVDCARMPVYLINQWEEITSLWSVLVVATIGVLLGTILGEKILRRIPEPIFRHIISSLLLLLGAFMLWRAGS